MENLGFEHIQQEDNYYHEYVRLYLANIALTSQVKDLVQEKNRLETKLSRYEVEEVCSSQRNCERNKRYRRTAHEIQRFYKCVVQNCQKSYGSQGSLNQHYKLKHPEMYEKLPNVQPSRALQQSHINQELYEQISHNSQKQSKGSTIKNEGPKKRCRKVHKQN